MISIRNSILLKIKLIYSVWSIHVSCSPLLPLSNIPMRHFQHSFPIKRSKYVCWIGNSVILGKIWEHLTWFNSIQQIRRKQLREYQLNVRYSSQRGLSLALRANEKGTIRKGKCRSMGGILIFDIFNDISYYFSHIVYCMQIILIFFAFYLKWDLHFIHTKYVTYVYRVHYIHTLVHSTTHSPPPDLAGD